MDLDPYSEFGASVPDPSEPTPKQRRAIAVKDLALCLVRDRGETPIEAYAIAGEFYDIAEDQTAQANVEPGED